jgi:hypothetical protein
MHQGAHNERETLKCPGQRIGRPSRQSRNDHEGDGIDRDKVEDAHGDLPERGRIKGRILESGVDQPGNHLEHRHNPEEDRHA